MTSKPRTASSRFQIRPATSDDIPGLTDVFFRSFNAPFWLYFLPDKPAIRKWWDDSWQAGLNNPENLTFVAVDTQSGDKVVGFSRWQLPQADGDTSYDESFAEMDPSNWDCEVAEPFFAGMDANREKLMGKRPHWFLDLLGVHEDYQRNGIAASLILWGTQQADKEGVETMLHGSQVGQPYYIKYFDFKAEGSISLPDRPAYGSYGYKTLIRQPQKS